MKQHQIITIADLCVDISLYSDDLNISLNQSEKILDDTLLELGGACSIFASQCAKLNNKTKIIGTLGKDFFGEFVLNRIKSSGIDASLIKFNENIKTGVSFALCKGEDRAILTYLGSINETEIDTACLEEIKKSTCLHIGSYFLNSKIRPHLKDIAKIAKKNNVLITVDTNWDVNEKWDLLDDELIKYVDIFLPNETELLKIFNEKEIDVALKRAVEVFPVVALKQGSGGAIVKTKKDEFSVSKLDVLVEDTVGAGDSFDGGFIHGYLKNEPLETCLKMGLICGGLNVTRQGGINGQPNLELLNKYMEELK